MTPSEALSIVLLVIAIDMHLFRVTPLAYLPTGYPMYSPLLRIRSEKKRTRLTQPEKKFDMGCPKAPLEHTLSELGQNGMDTVGEGGEGDREAERQREFLSR